MGIDFCKTTLKTLRVGETRCSCVHSMQLANREGYRYQLPRSRPPPGTHAGEMTLLSREQDCPGTAVESAIRERKPLYKSGFHVGLQSTFHVGWPPTEKQYPLLPKDGEFLSRAQDYAGACHRYQLNCPGLVRVLVHTLKG